MTRARRGGARPPTSHRRVLVLGGARSGKSSFAEGLAATLGQPVLYVATATALDDEMADRIRQHQAQRPRQWRTLEAPVDVAGATASSLADAGTVLVEDLTLLLSNLMVGPSHTGTPDAGDAAAAERRACQELDGLLRLPAHLILVSNEVGLGLVPTYPIGRAFRDALGRLNQRAAARVAEVYFLLAGLPVALKPGAGTRAAADPLTWIVEPRRPPGAGASPVASIGGPT